MSEIDREAIKKRLTNFLNANEFGVVSTSGEGGQPESATVGYLANSNLDFLFLTEKTSRKVKNILKNPKVAFVVGTTKSVNTFQVEGVAEIFGQETPEYKEIFVKVSPISPAFHGPSLDMKENNLVAVKIRTTWARWRTLDISSGKADYFQLIPSSL